jgi:ATP-dependent helicase/nuclease subunit A
MNLSPEQQAVVGAWGSGVAVMAGAGSGKTTTLVLKCIELMRRKPGARFAAVSFTERSASDLKAKLSEKISEADIPGRREGGPLAGHWVMTIHGLAAAILREFPREAGCDGGETMLSGSEAALTWERAIGSLWLDDASPEVREAMDGLLATESRDSLVDLLVRVRELAGFGVLGKLNEADDLRSRMLARLSAHVLERYERIKRRGGLLDFSDLESFALRALENPGVREAFRSRFDLVLVDEFQDTNPVQAAIIRAFCREDLSNLCVVGDPKQSIYRFRDADVTLFEEFCASLPARHSLTWNFRSRPGIIDYVNELCGAAFPEGGLKYEALVPRLEASPEFDPVVRLDIEQPADLARWILSEVARGVPLSDMALLVRRIRGNEKWLKALASSGIPLAVGSGGLFWEDPRVRELIAFLRWWDDPANALSAAVFLRAPWVGVSDTEIDEWVRRDPTFVEPFFSSSHALARALLPFRSRVVRPGELLLALAVSPEIEAELGAALLGVWHRAEEFSSRGHGFREVVAEFTRARDEKRRERDVPPPKNQGQLSVLTLHSSKGLEFRHVILIDFAGKRRSPNAPLLFWDRKEGAFLAPRDSEGERDPRSPDEIRWRADEKHKSLAESMRLFYVALTRAQERLVFAVPPEKPKAASLAKKSAKKTEVSESETLPSAFGSDDWCAWIDAGPAPSSTLRASEITLAAASPALQTHPTQAAAQAGAAWMAHASQGGGRQRPRHSVTEWNMLSICPRRYEWTYVRPRAVAEPVRLSQSEEIPAFMDHESLSGLSRRELGTRVHACLERSDLEGLKSLEAEVGRRRLNSDSLIRWAEQSEWMMPPGDGVEIWSELPFELKIGREVLVGSIDRVILKGSQLSVIDFKVTEKPKTTEAWLETYQTQLELYVEAVAALAGDRATQLDAYLVNISPSGVESIAVPIDSQARLKRKVLGLSVQAGTIVAGEVGAPRPSRLCGICEFKNQCPEAQA